MPGQQRGGFSANLLAPTPAARGTLFVGQPTRVGHRWLTMRAVLGRVLAETVAGAQPISAALRRWARSATATLRRVCAHGLRQQRWHPGSGFAAAARCSRQCLHRGVHGALAAQHGASSPTGTLQSTPGTAPHRLHHARQAGSVSRRRRSSEGRPKAEREHRAEAKRTMRFTKGLWGHDGLGAVGQK